MNELALFAGAGGGILGGKLLGWRTVCAVEWDAYARDVLVARQNDGCLEAFPIWDDIQTFDGRPWRGRVDVVSGGFPCQDISAAGKGVGITGERSGMWVEMARIIGEVRPRFAFVENSPMLTSRGLGTCLGDLAALGYHARWGVVGANAAGAPHKRERIWIVAYDPRGGWPAWGPRGSHPSSAGEPEQTLQDVPDSLRSERESRTGRRGVWEGNQELAEGYRLRHTAGARLPHGIKGTMGQPGTLAESERSDWWATEPELGRVAHGVACRVDRLRCIGNGQVPGVVPLAWNLLSQMNAQDDESPPTQSHTRRN